jgi:(R,R)-butanediol dehydrogenase / meso-butanediol dehydrogenase / diacetyl reductase
MKVAVYTGTQEIDIQDRPKPQVQRGEVLVKVAYCGICGSDVHGYLSGILIPAGTIMGHECSGTVEEVGEGVKNVTPGDRVLVKPLAPCKECYWCRKGEDSLCAEVFERSPGLGHVDGGFAEYIKINYPDEMIFKLSPEIRLDRAPLVEPLSTSLYAVHKSRFRPGDTTVVIGAGIIGLGTIRFLKLGGAGKIIALEISVKKSLLASQFGASAVLNPEKEGEGLMEKILALTDGMGADIVYECSGVPAAFTSCINYVRKGGQVMIVGIPDGDVPINPLQIIVKEIELKGVLAYHDEFEQVLEFMKRKEIDTDVLVSDIISMNEINEKGFKSLISNKDSIKILVKP